MVIDKAADLVTKLDRGWNRLTAPVGTAFARRSNTGNPFEAVLRLSGEGINFLLRRHSVPRAAFITGSGAVGLLGVLGKATAADHVIVNHVEENVLYIALRGTGAESQLNNPAVAVLSDSVPNRFVGYALLERGSDGVYRGVYHLPDYAAGDYIWTRAFQTIKELPANPSGLVQTPDGCVVSTDSLYDAALQLRVDDSVSACNEPNLLDRILNGVADFGNYVVAHKQEALVLAAAATLLAVATTSYVRSRRQQRLANERRLATQPRTRRPRRVKSPEAALVDLLFPDKK